jgi:hypothetical protein
MSKYNEFDVVEAEKAPPIDRSAIPLYRVRLPGMAGWLIAKGIVKTESGARVVLVCFMIFNFAIAGLVLFFFDKFFTWSS